MRVLKFGGSSVATPEAIHRVVAIVRSGLEIGPVTVVVSAFGGVTNRLLSVAAAAADRDQAWQQGWEELRARHREAATELRVRDVDSRLERYFDELHDLLRGIFLLRELSPRASDGLVTYGERLSAMVVAGALRHAGIDAEDVDTRGLILTNAQFGRAQVDFETSYVRLRERLGKSGPTAVVTGFTGSTPEGHTTTLGRGGSDYTAALVGAALEAEAVELWTDVSGVMSADPRIVERAFAQPEMSYAELMELSHFGAKVVYPPSIHPARSRGIPLWIKNTFDPEHVGTRVTEASAPSEGPIRGITSIRRVALVRLEGDGMVGVPGIAQRLFGALAREKVSVILISQSSSEHSICFVVDGGDAEAARHTVDGEFALERRVGIVDDLVVEDGHTVVAAVGEQMALRPGIAGRLFGVLGEHGVNVRAIAQGSSELNISIVVQAAQEDRAVRVIHDAFFSSGCQRVDVALLGIGRVGAALLSQIRACRSRLLETEGLDLRVVALATSRATLLSPDGFADTGLEPEAARAALASVDAEGSHDVEERAEARAEASTRLAQHLCRRNGSRPVLVDCTSADGLHGLYRHVLGQGAAVVAANKKPFSGPLEEYRALARAAAVGEGHRPSSLLHETTVGAGLPVLGPLRDLVRTGDQILRIDAVLSGTLNAVLDALTAEVSFSRAVVEAHGAGLTEPNPYDDLSGMDVMRKLCILARVAGRGMEPTEIEVEPLLAAQPWGELELDTFWQRLFEVDEGFESRRATAAAAGQRLRYVASFEAESGSARVGLRSVGPEHPAFALRGPDNLVAITSQRYREHPLVIRGPGAGPEVTAAGVFADILKAVGR